MLLICFNFLLTNICRVLFPMFELIQIKAEVSGVGDFCWALESRRRSNYICPTVAGGQFVGDPNL